MLGIGEHWVRPRLRHSGCGWIDWGDRRPRQFTAPVNPSGTSPRATVYQAFQRQIHGAYSTGGASSTCDGGRRSPSEPESACKCKAASLTQARTVDHQTNAISVLLAPLTRALLDTLPIGSEELPSRGPDHGHIRNSPPLKRWASITLNPLLT